MVLNKYVEGKGAMFFGGIDAFAAGLIEAFSNMWGVILLGRLILGICCGIMTTSTVPMYLAECAPTDIRSIFTAGIPIGICSWEYYIGLLLMSYLVV
ncbi:hypothetical protein GAYE_SCF06G2732 [Galdieria yellowstonensis]|uniref:Major facilitator superfamily (MFS) profile domain-containing protein n=1 Tax=Galdieria yellowstonensis TaxID=3028027 RepID=A0AAV9IBN6_9RHOD|nr:hypothetical protein GAYE_SCF06G2732 [Galdieria yellowstonensis]